MVALALSTWGEWAILAPALGGLIIGLMARYGSERIRGHGIPEAMEECKHKRFLGEQAVCAKWVLPGSSP